MQLVVQKPADSRDGHLHGTNDDRVLHDAMLNAKKLLKRVQKKVQGSEAVPLSDELCEKCMTCLVRTREWKGDTHTHHEDLQSFEDSLASACWICTAVLTRLSPHQREILLDEETYADKLYFSFVQISDTSDPWTNGPKGAFAWHLLVSAADRIRDEARKSGGGDGQSSLFLWAQPSNSIDQRMLATPEGLDTRSDEAWAKAKGWLRKCNQEHKSCARSTGKLSHPTRLLDVGSTDLNMDYVRLIDTTETPMVGEYMTLSHSWGTSPFLTLRRDNVQDFKQAVSISSLNKTFQHAIETTRRMSIRFLWIDSLCTIQDEPSLADWAKESIEMGRYYSHAYCNLSATASRSGSEGLFRTRETDSLRHIRCHLPSGYGRVAGQYNLSNVTLFDRHLAEAPLHRRAWVLQERLLARRVLHFCEDQLMWECREQTVSEMYPFGVPDVGPLLDRSRFKDLDLTSSANQTYFGSRDAKDVGYQLWSKICQEYSECFLTFARDKSKAFEGLTRLFEESLHDECVFGLWRSRMEKELLWRPIDMSYPPVNRLYDTARVYDEIPSWSWMSCDVPLQTASPPGSYAVKDERFLFKIVFLPSQARNEIGRIPPIEDRTILLQCLLLPAEVRLDQHGNANVHWPSEPEPAGSSIQYIRMNGPVDELDNAGDSVSIFIAPMRRFVEKDRTGDSSKPQLDCLLLRYVDGKQYRRIAHMSIEGRAAVWGFTSEARSVPQSSSWGYDEKNRMHTISLI